jgi:hypothetical protein
MLDLRTHRPEGLDIGERHLSMRSKPWAWNGGERWWEVFTTVTGFNGAGGYWVRQDWHWNGSPEINHYHIRSLSAEESRQLDADIAALARPRPTVDGATAQPSIS